MLPAPQAPSAPIHISPPPASPRSPAFGGNHFLALLSGLSSSVCVHIPEQHDLAVPDFSYKWNIHHVDSSVPEVPPLLPVTGSFTFVAV